jgi:hypothetical protein
MKYLEMEVTRDQVDKAVRRGTEFRGATVNETLGYSGVRKSFFILLLPGGKRPIVPTNMTFVEAKRRMTDVLR